MSCRRGAVSKTIGLVSTKFFLFLHSVLAGHADGGCSNQVGPFHHNLNGISWLGVFPLEATSAGLQSVGTYLQWEDGIRLTVSATRLQTYVFSLEVGEESQHSTMVESHHANTSAREIEQQKSRAYSIAELH